MSYKIDCPKCNKPSRATNIVDLVSTHLDNGNMLKCTNCGASGAYIFMSSETQNDEGPWKRWVKGIIHFGTDDYHPYVFLIADSDASGKINSLQISYYKDYRKVGGSLKHGHGPGGTPVLNISDLNCIIQNLIGLQLMTQK